MITPQNLVRHELIGLTVLVTDHAGSRTKGRVVDESRNTLTVDVSGFEKKFIKDQCVFRFLLPVQMKWVKVDGRVIVARPEDRIKKKLKPW
ncbi:MAG: ribonuclease P protein subunit [Candidatus Aenigmarchaeota archaeon]|nr:ribonuclease P protein subunit [Candidatus Aenigmarchaeota archaeon]